MIMGKNFEVAIGLSKLHLIKKKSLFGDIVVLTTSHCACWMSHLLSKI